MAKSRLKIVFIGWGGSIHVQRWVRWFAGRGHEVHLISDRYEAIPGVTVHPLTDGQAGPAGEGAPPRETFLRRLISKLKFYYLSYLRYPAYIARTRRIIREVRPDILQGFYLGFAGYLGAASGFHPFMVFTGGADLLVFARRFLLHRLWTKRALSRIDFLAHPSEDSDEAARRLGYPAAKSKVLHIGVDLEIFRPGGAENLKQKLGLAGHPMVLSTRGLFDKYYNISGLLRAFALVVEARPDARLVLKYYSAPEKDKFVKLAKELGIYDKIMWVGRGEYQDMPAYYRAADVYVSLSFTDSGPVSLLEAIACGCVPITSNLKNLGRWVRDGWNGYLVEPRDHRSAAGHILRVIGDRELKAALAARGLELVREQADQEKCFRELERVSLALVSGGKGGDL